MSKTRVYEMAKDIGMNTKDFIQLLKNEFNIKVKSHMSTLEDDTVEAILDLMEEENKKKIAKKETTKNLKKDSKSKEKNENNSKKEVEPPIKPEGENKIEEIIIAQDELKLDKLAQKMGKNQNDLIKAMFMQGIVLRPGQDLSPEMVEDIALNMNYLVTIKEASKVSSDPAQHIINKWDEYYKYNSKKLKIRPPVVTVMGHVDHGKTTLLDNIRGESVAESEAGGITQSIGAYQVEYNNKKITFIDTPGHEAFTEMRARGAQATDIVILIVAADDGVMPQTIEAYNHAKDAGVPIIVAINKVDKPNANVELTKQQMVAKLNLIPEDWGGDTITVEISAKSGKGIEDLLEMILLVSEVEEIKCKPNGNARAVIIDSKLDKFLGPIATVIVKDGVLKTGDFFIAGSTHGKVRRMLDDKGKTIKAAGPSTPVQLLGFDEVADMHSILYVVDTLDEARNISSIKKEMLNIQNQRISKKHVKLEDLMKMMEEDQKKVLNIVLKASTFGEIEALKNSISKLQNKDIDIEVIHAGIGSITNSDVMLASASDAVIMGFRVKADSKTIKEAEKEGIQIKKYDIIFNLIDDLKKALQGMLDPEEKEEITGSGKIKEVFKIKKVGNIAGVQILEGFVTRNGKVRIYRNGGLVNDVSIESLKHYKDEVKMVDAPKECGIKFENFDDISSGDELEFYRYVQIERQLDFNK
ncbi:translation initiation factor IF-2 [Oceanotoga sp. DSM 15011]|uniref:translation initiation factor IF-2 n=1 Tax=Oceanotoga sp. DSM 15011 TaxID=2984951 RepID=UPI00299004DF|nr:translation initiation factor IF-2 [Oceanotoga sp. DSM 15011]